MESSNIRKQLPLIKETLIRCLEREREYEKYLMEARQERTMVQAYYNTLEIRLAELEDTIQRPAVNPTRRKSSSVTIIDEALAIEKMLKNFTAEQIASIKEAFNKQ